MFEDMAGLPDLREDERSPKTLAGLLGERATMLPHRRIFTFLADGESEAESLTYSELDARARAIAGMLGRECKPGERALLIYPFGLEVVKAFFGCLCGGIVAVPAPPPNPARPQRTIARLRSMVEDAEVRLGLTTSEMLPSLEQICRETDGLRGVRWLATDEAGPGSATSPEEIAINGESLAYLQYTSGSTTAPKGAMVTHANVLHNSAYIARAWGYTSDSISVAWVPYYHDDGLVHGIVQSVYRGGETFLMSPQSFIERPARWLRAITYRRATHAGGPNFAYDLCVNKVTPEQREGLALSSWRMAYNAAEPVRAETLERFAAAFAPHGFNANAFYPSYGLAEATLLVTTKRDANAPALRIVRAEALERQRRIVEAAPDEDRPRTFVSCGSPVGETRVVIARPRTMEICDDDEVGEILISDCGVVRGYWRREEESADTFGARLAVTDEGPFLRTGDLGFMSGGELYIAGRIKDLIIIRGQNYYPQDIEWTVERSHALLRPGSCAAFAVEINGEERLAIAVEVGPHCAAISYDPAGKAGHTLTADLPFDADEIIASIRQAVADGHELQPHAILLLKSGDVPKTSSGKIQRHVCREAFLAGTFEVAAAWVQSSAAIAAHDQATDAVERNGATPEAVRSWLIEQLKQLAPGTRKLSGPALDLDLQFNRLGLDSIAAFELKHMIEMRWGVELPVVSLLGDATITQLAGWVGERAATQAVKPSVHEANGELLLNLEQLSETELDRAYSRLLAEAEDDS